jgi:dihydroxy-acid dehydratase
MAAASVDLPAIMVLAGPMLAGRYQGQRLGACTDCRKYWGEHRAGNLSDEQLSILEGSLCPSTGTCMVMGTASTMACLTEALGMTLPGGAAIPAPFSERVRQAEDCGRRIVAMVQQDLRPSRILTREAFENAIRVLHACGGSTNAVIHLVAIAGRLGIPLPLSLFDELSRTTPMLVNLRPSGKYHMEDLWEAGGVPVVLKELEPLLRLNAMTVTGKTWGDILPRVPRAGAWQEAIAPREKPLHPEGGLAILGGNLAPDGAVIKQSAATPKLLAHRGRAVVFTSQQDLAERVDSADLDVKPEDILVMQNAGPIGAPGMPEAGYLPLPKKLLAQGVRDMVRISDARMSGTAFGTIVLHVAPEAAVGGPLALVRTGDEILLDVPNRKLELLVPGEELIRRRGAWRPPAPAFRRGYGKLFLDHILQAPDGCDFDFLRPSPEGPSPCDPRAPST